MQVEKEQGRPRKPDSEKKTVVSENTGEKRGRGRPKKTSAEKAATKKAPKRRVTCKKPTSQKRKS